VSTSVVKLLSIQYLRGAAALLVVFLHVVGQLNRLGYNGNSFEVLNVGVDIFFVISGFIMWYTTFNSNVGPSEFLRRRIIRIVPLYWVVTTIYVILLIVRPSVFQSDKFQLSHIIASYLFTPAVHPVLHEMWPVVVPGWTLNYEMFFYLLFAFSLIFLVRGRALIIVSTLACVVGLQVFDPLEGSIVGFYTSSIILEFAFGVVLAVFYTSGLSIPTAYAVLLGVAGCISLILAAEVSSLNLPRVLALGVPACLIVACVVFYERAHGVTRIALPVLLGDASYSLYLSHGAVLSAFEQIWRFMAGPHKSEPILLSLFSTTAIILAAVVGIGLYRFVERPMLRKLSAHFSEPTAT
jgi:exopolysaccharide production protein ExoZ